MSKHIKQCLFLNPLQRDGTSQNQRLLDALLPSSAPIDERSLADMLVYTQKYAKLLRYYANDNTPTSDWSTFIQHDVSVSIALLSVNDYAQQKKYFDNNHTHVLAENTADLTALAALFDTIFELAQQINHWFQNTQHGLALHTSLQRLINSVLKDALHDIVARALNAKNIGIVVEIPDYALFHDIWGKLSAISAATNLSLPLSNDALATELRSINRDFEFFYKAVVFSVEHADDYLQETLDHYSQHQPHMALLLAFLQLFSYAQRHLNTLTRKHLHFYYEEILQLQRKAAQPDQVHLVFKLAKQLDQYRLEKQSAFKAGKDSNDHHLFYASDNELLINKATLSEEHGLKSVFIHKALSTSNDTADDTSTPIHAIYAAPYANSSDGMGADIVDDDGKWNTFGSRTMPEAMLGFAVASPMLLLAEGQREIRITFNLKTLGSLQSVINSEQAIAAITAGVTVFLSGEKAWLPFSLTKVIVKEAVQAHEIVDKEPLRETPEKPVKPSPTRPIRLPDIIGLPQRPRHDFRRGFRFHAPLVASTDKLILHRMVRAIHITPPQPQKSHPSYIEFHLQLDAEDEAIVAYNDALLRDGFATSHPVAKFVLAKKGKHKTPYAYQYLNNIIIQSMNISVNVHGVRNLLLENDLGILSPAKPFYPFGSIPKKGSKFYIGSNEVFQKSLQQLTLEVTWGDLPTVSFNKYYAGYPEPVINNAHFKTAFKQLHKGVWTDLAPNTQATPLFADKNKLISEARHFNYQLNKRGRPNKVTRFKRYHVGLRYGFIRAELLNSFLHNLYPTALATAITTTPKPAIPNPPYTPLISELTLNYSATEVTDFKHKTEQFFHIAPFGHVEVSSPCSLMTDFFVTANSKQIAEGSLYIGIDKLKPPQNLSILFQVAESSADPNLKPPTLFWSYMVNNHWVAFTNAEILADNTNGLLTSGIIRFAIPKAITANNTLLPKDLHWIKASVAKDSNGITQLIDVKPQAVVASFDDQHNDLSHLASALAAKTISKLKKRDTAIKGVSQPFASFGGQLPEGDHAFYRRVSERLRHKGRAITIFDYERLVLEQFPAIYKVKCINHTHQDNEFSPGHVRLIVVPDLRNKNAIDPLRPKATVNTLQAIERYLKRLSSDFVSIEVSNPHYEEIKVFFNVIFHQGYDEGFYLQQLEQEIIKFLSPWLYDDVADISFGGRIHRTWILNHIEEQEYVDFVTDFRMDHIIALKSGQQKPTSTLASIRHNIEQATVQSSSSVLVSSKTHTIKPAKPLVCEQEAQEE